MASVVFLAFLAFTFNLAGVARAQESIYRCEFNGVVSFTNVKAEAKGKPCRRVTITKKKRRYKKVDRVAEKNFPKINPKTQKKLDEKRASLIRDELKIQKKILDDINQRLTHFKIQAGSDQQKQFEHFKTLNEKRRLHHKTVKELEKQLSIM